MNPQLILVLLLAAAAWWMKKQAANVARNRPGQRPPGRPEPDEEERTRRVREEVRRRIEERRRAAGRAPPLTEAEIEPAVPQRLPPPLFPEPEREAPRPEFAREEPAPDPVIVAQSAAVLAAQKRLEEQLRALEEAEARLGRARPSAAPVVVVLPATAQTQLVAGDLRSAVIWREILGPPVGLR